MSDRPPREGARWNRAESIPELSPKSSTPLSVDEDRVLREKLIAVYGAENYDKALSIYTKVEYAYPDQPLTNLRPVQFAKELLDEGKRNEKFNQECGESCNLEEYLDYFLKKPDRMEQYVYSSSLISKIHFGSPRIHGICEIIGKSRKGKLSTKDQFRWFSLTKGSLIFWVFIFPLLMAFIRKFAGIIWISNFPYMLGGFNINIIVTNPIFLFITYTALSVKSPETPHVTWTAIVVYTVAVISVVNMIIPI